MSKAKEKGNYLEEFVAKKIRDYFNMPIRDVHRAQSSGVYTTEFGDVYFRKHAIIIECKNQKAVTPTKIFPKLSKEVYNFYKQVNKDTLSFNEQYPDQNYLELLVITNSSERLPKYCLIELNHFNDSITKGIIDKHILIDESIAKMHVIYKENNNYKFKIFLFEDLIKYININLLEY